MRPRGTLTLAILIAASNTFAQSFPDKYHTYAEGIAELQILASQHPDICALDSVGYSNRDSIIIYQFKISDNVAIEEDEPAILFTGGVHADEILGPEVVINFSDDIITQYLSGDPEIVSYVNDFEIFVIPFVNPEGHMVVEQGGTEWRKNKTDNNNNGEFDFHDGVDCNRNYDFGWDLDIGPEAVTPESLTYKGAYPFSESECRAIRDLGLKYKPIVAVEYHSPTYGRSEVVYYNWYWDIHGFAPDEVSMRNIGRGFAGSIVNDDGDSTYEARRGLVNKGDFKTYFYGNFGTAAFTCEVSDTTIQDTSMVDSICLRNLAGMYYLLERSGYARLSGMVTDSLTGLPLEAEVIVEQAAGPEINPRFTRFNTGRYDRLIDPGTYTLTFLKDGYVSKSVTGVVVTNSAVTVTDVGLVPLGILPESPALISPAAGAAFEDSTNLDFDWEEAAFANGFIIEISTDISFSVNFEFDSSLAASFYRNQTEFYPDRFYWRVTAYNNAGYSPSSEIRWFDITGGDAPPTPDLLLPVDGYLTDRPYLYFDWTDAANADHNAIEIATDSLFEITVLSDTGLMNSEYSNTDSLPDNIYYWRVRAGNQYGWSLYSGLRSFEIDAETNYVYTPGDVNHSGGVNGLDVVYLVSYLKGGAPPPLEIDGFYPEADANGSCSVNGLDVVYLVSYLKSGPPPIDGNCF